MNKFIIISLLSIALSLMGICVWREFIYQPKLCHTSLAVENKLKTGDLVLSAGGRLKSDVVRWRSTSDSEFSHIGFVVRRDGVIHVVHMSSDLDTIKNQTMSDFIKTADSEALEFFRFIEPIDTMRLVQSLDSLLAIKKPFDSGFDIHSDDKYYCTELVLKTLRDIGDYRYHNIKFDGDLYPDDFVNSGLLRSVAKIEN